MCKESYVELEGISLFKQNEDLFFSLRISRCALPRSDDRLCTLASRTILGIRSPQFSKVEHPSCNTRSKSQPSSD